MFQIASLRRFFFKERLIHVPTPMAQERISIPSATNVANQATWPRNAKAPNTCASSAGSRGTSLKTAQLQGIRPFRPSLTGVNRQGQSIWRSHHIAKSILWKSGRAMRPPLTPVNPRLSTSRRLLTFLSTNKWKQGRPGLQTPSLPTTFLAGKVRGLGGVRRHRRPISI